MSKRNSSLAFAAKDLAYNDITILRAKIKRLEDCNQKIEEKLQRMTNVLEQVESKKKPVENQEEQVEIQATEEEEFEFTEMNHFMKFLRLK